MVLTPDEEDQEGHAEPAPIAKFRRTAVGSVLAAGLLVMFLFYTGWGLLEIYSLPQATLP